MRIFRRAVGEIEPPLQQTSREDAVRGQGYPGIWSNSGRTIEPKTTSATPSPAEVPDAPTQEEKPAPQQENG